ncbi:MAG TPA: hypothetical protein VN228_15635 [Pyrinomonadaceae bacterium]|nr:hypothetical protein [Pyrinomonadaceae bacterium]
MKDITIDFRLHAEVNGQTFDMNGEGVGSFEAGTCSLHLEASPKFPAGFDPVSCPAICSHPTSSFFSRPVAEGQDLRAVSAESYRVEPARHGVIYDASGAKVLDLHVSGEVYMEGGRLVSVHRMWGTSHLPPLEKNLTPYRDYLVPSAGGEATGIVRYKLLAKSGEELDGLTIVPYRWDTGLSLQSPLVREVEDIRVEWDGGRLVSAYYTTAIRPLYTNEQSALNLALPVGFGMPVRAAS